jgi:hypothetical protein
LRLFLEMLCQTSECICVPLNAYLPALLTKCYFPHYKHETVSSNSQELFIKNIAPARQYGTLPSANASPFLIIHKRSSSNNAPGTHFKAHVAAHLRFQTSVNPFISTHKSSSSNIAPGTHLEAHTAAHSFKLYWPSTVSNSTVSAWRGTHI